MAAALLARSFQRVQAVDPGFRPAHVLSIRLSLPSARYDSAIAIDSFYEAVEAANRRDCWRSRRRRRQRRADERLPRDCAVLRRRCALRKDAPEAHYRMISLDISARSASWCAAAARSASRIGGDAAPVAIINETFARQYFAGRIRSAAACVSTTARKCRARSNRRRGQ